MRAEKREREHDERTRDGEKDPNAQSGREAERDEESRCSLYPSATSVILAMKDRNTEEK